jgi:hypothetical protein
LAEQNRVDAINLADKIYTNALVKRSAELRRSGEQIARDQENSSLEMFSASTSVDRANRRTYMADNNEDTIAKARILQERDDSQRANRDLFESGRIPVDELARLQLNAATTARFKTDAIEVAARGREKDNAFNIRQGAGQGVIDRQQATADYQNTIGNTFDATSGSRAIAISQQRLTMASKLKELEALEKANEGNTDPEVVKNLRTMREELEKISQIQLDQINAQFSNFKGILGETNEAFTGLLGSVTEGKGSFGQSLLNLLLAPLKGLKQGLDKYLISQFSGLMDGLLSPLTKQLDTASGQAVAGGKSGGGFNWLGAGLSVLGSLVGFEDGGIIGTGKSLRDDTPIMTMRGEGVLTHKGVDAIGGETALKLINLGVRLDTLPRFATGGIVGSMGVSSAVNNIQPFNRSQINNFNSTISIEGSRSATSEGNSEVVRKAMEAAMAETVVKLKRQGVI